MNIRFFGNSTRNLTSTGIGLTPGIGLVLGIGLMLATPLMASAPSVTDYDAVPPLLAESATPMVMLAMSNDHQLFYKAYTDFDDLDDDGFADTTYKHSF